MDVDAYLAEQSARVDRFLEARVPGPGEQPGRLHAAMRHLLFPGGKRFRPALALAAARAVGGDPDAALPVAAAVELVFGWDGDGPRARIAPARTVDGFTAAVARVLEVARGGGRIAFATAATASSCPTTLA